MPDGRIHGQGKWCPTDRVLNRRGDPFKRRAHQAQPKTDLRGPGFNSAGENDFVAVGETMMSEGPVLLPFEDRSLRGEYRKYFIQKRKNNQVMLRDLPELWDCCLRLDEIWMRGLSDMQIHRNPSCVVTLALFRNAHGNFRIAFELAFSTALNRLVTLFAARSMRQS
jgi:hypothetical protein